MHGRLHSQGTSKPSASRARELFAMPNDAKLGLVLGVGLVVAIAVVFFRKEPAPAAAAPGPAPAAVSPTGPEPPAPPGPPARFTRHVVRQGDTLYSLARRYYKSDARFVEL